MEIIFVVKILLCTVKIIVYHGNHSYLLKYLNCWNNIKVKTVAISELFWSEFVRAAIFIMLLPFCFAALNLTLSIYLPTSNLPTNLAEWSCLSKFSESSFTAKTVPFVKTVYREIQFKQRLYTNFLGLWRYVLSSKTVELDSQSLLFIAMF